MTETLQVTPPHLEPIEGPAAWKREDLEGTTDWIRPLSPATLSELTAAVEKIEAEGKTLDTVVAKDFALPSFRAEAREILDVIRKGRGLVLLRGLPRGEATDDQLCLMYWGLGSQLGSTVGQNVKGDRMFSVINEGQDIGKVGQRGSKSPYALGFHTDSSPAFRGVTPDIVGLLALQTARRGGASIVVSTATLHNELLRKAPAALKRLYGLYHFDRRSEIVEGEEPTIRAPVFTYDEGVRMRYASPYLLRGHEVAGEPLWTDDITPLIALHTIMEHRALSFRFDLEDGDILLLNNHAVMHARSAFDEHPEPERRRHLMRMWLKFFDD